MFEVEYPNTCLSCGFASWVDRHKPVGNVQPLTAGQRAKGSVGDEHTLWCFRHQAQLEAETKAAELEFHKESASTPWGLRQALVFAVLSKGRAECPEWEIFEDSMDPAWHLEARRRRLVEEQRRQWQTDMEESRKAWEVTFQATLEESRRAFEKELAADTKAFEERMAEAERRRADRDRNVGYCLAGAAIFFAIAEVAGSFLQVAIAKQWFGL